MSYTNPILDEDVIVIDDGTLEKKRSKKCTSDVWQYFTKKNKVMEVDGNKFVQLWGYYNFPKCKASYRAESHAGTSGFWNHLRSAHSIVKGQTCLKAEKDHEKGITVIQPYKYDPEVSLKKLYLTIIMHEYPFSIVEHEYFVEFIKSLRPNFPIKSRVTTRKDIMDIYLNEKEKLYVYLKTVKCRFECNHGYVDIMSKQVIYVCHPPLDR
ncbi:hypothetical protein PR202_gb26871 [Eleusine coracana subsp. coracana]|uniref:Uncharacterized protein n=1 Tax=Eleusine coracana subsp. coracana TaxID=191504 RepID=A0AAV5FQB4_ELECO|nr:hypothetical protein PR202_gb26871 [Eleusine coracana subsp. coracana]